MLKIIKVEKMFCTQDATLIESPNDIPFLLAPGQTPNSLCCRVVVHVAFASDFRILSNARTSDYCMHYSITQ